MPGQLQIELDSDSELGRLAKALRGRDLFAPTPQTQPPIRRTEAYAHQVEAYHFAMPRQAMLFKMAMGTGKSKVVVDLITNWGCKRVLILCPKSVLDVWEAEFHKHAAEHPALLVLYDGSVAEKAWAAEQWLARAVGMPAVVVINYESARIKAFAEWSLARRWDLAVLDESHRAKAPSGVTARYVAKLGRVADRRLCLTGTPMPHSPMDIFSQSRFLDAGLFGTSWIRFRQRYAVIGGYENKQVVDYQHMDELSRLMGLVTYQCGADVLDLPETTDHTRRFDLSKQAQKHYDELESELVTEVEGGAVTAANALVKLLRLQQVTSGFLPVNSSMDAHIDTGKAALLAELLEDIGPEEKVVVFCRFRHDLDAIKRVAEQIDRTCGEISGRTNEYREWKKGEFSTLAVQIQAGSLGIDLTEARYAVYYSMGFSLGDYSQSRARIHRPGQERPVHYYHLLARSTVDEKVLGAIRKKADIVESVLASLKGDSHEA